MINPDDIKAGYTLGHADAEMLREAIKELLALRKEKLMLGIYHESKPRFYPRFNVVYMDDNKVCGYTLHTGRFSAFERKNFDKNFIKAGLVPHITLK